MEERKLLQRELDNQKDYVFFTDKVTYSSVGLKGNKQSYVTGYIAVPEVDIENDLVTKAAMKSMLKQLSTKNIVLDYEHESFRDDNSILPVGKIVEAKIDDRGLWVKAVLNSNSPKYNALWGSVKDGFLNAFSIAFKALKTVEKSINGTTVRLIEDLELFNVALTGTPKSKGSTITGFSMKSVMLKAIEDTKEEKVLVTKSLITKLMEENKMENEKIDMKDEAVETEAPVEAPTEEAPAKEEEAKPEAKEEAAEESTEATPEEPVKTEESNEVVEKVEQKALEELTAKVEAHAKENAELKSDLKALKESPVFKSTISNKPLVEKKSANMLDLI